jgi:putative ABC transport system ATP-binding protein
VGEKPNNMLQTSALTFSYNHKHTFHFPGIQCSSKEKLLIIGESGTGKTTFLHLLSGLLTPKTGSIKIDDTDITQLKGSTLDHFRGQNIGLVFQKSYLITSLTVRDNLLAAQYLAGNKQDKKRVYELLERLNMGKKANSKVQELSQGEQQRVVIARALINRPKVVFADEPTSSLDDKNCEQVLHLLEEQAAIAQAGLIIVTHDQRLKDKFPKQLPL